MHGVNASSSICHRRLWVSVLVCTDTTLLLHWLGGIRLCGILHLNCPGSPDYIVEVLHCRVILMCCLYLSSLPF